MKHFNFFWLLIFLLCGQRGFSQTFGTCSFSSTTPAIFYKIGSVQACGTDKIDSPTSTIRLGFTAYLFKKTGSTVTGNVSIQAGTSPTSLVSTALGSSGPILSNSWVVSSFTGYDQVIVSGDFDLTPAVASANTGLYLVFYNTSTSPAIKGEVSEPIIINSPLGPPSLTSLSPSSGPSGTTVNILGNNLTNISQVLFNNTNMGTSLTIKIPIGTLAGSYPVKVITASGTSNTINFTVTPPATRLPSIFSVMPGTGTVGTSFNILGSNNWLEYTITSITCNGANIPSWSITSDGFSITGIKIPSNATLGIGEVVVVTTVGSARIGFTVKGLEEWIPCGRDVAICGDPCIAYGASATIRGRISANSDYDSPNPNWVNYENAAKAAGTTTFASGNEFEALQWQISYDNANWSDISNATQNDYLTGSITRKTYYRRVSTHLVKSWTFWTSREYWYDSNIVTITPSLPPPTPTSTVYTSCGTSSISVAILPVPGATSYNWYAPSGWGINTGTFTSSRTPTLYPPAGVAPGTYQAYVEANGGCVVSPKTAINITINSGTGGPPTIPAASVKWVRTAVFSSCSPTYNLSMAVISGATSYQAADSYGNTVTGSVNPTTSIVTFPFMEYGPASGLTATVTAISLCGTSSYTTPAASLAGPPTTCGGSRIIAKSPNSLFPNPTADHVVIATAGQAAQVIFYDATGLAHKTVQLRGGSIEEAINVSDLPAGVYHVRIIVAGEVPLTKQLLIQR